jgi:hypothetical protein
MRTVEIQFPKKLRRFDRLNSVLREMRTDVGLRGNLWPILEHARLIASPDRLTFHISSQEVLTLIVHADDRTISILAEGPTETRAREICDRCLLGITHFAE